MASADIAQKPKNQTDRKAQHHDRIMEQMTKMSRFSSDDEGSLCSGKPIYAHFPVMTFRMFEPFADKKGCFQCSLVND